ncbi:MAG: teichoic acid D-Ala incorporation-associated protein DltX [Limosilactobacillus sp.]|nr:teichoic acid D-Ala incorporation-associated protein DltX [Limosilactobacillus sp.]MCI1974672.1 teichoic acid D-Ala incorporation-associated protein DltX [Limosilactobacillus sp.]MCI2031175.1 teichoic acid D-Ala incorporation-associated protein DltX [Limosilactobacillus sp.]
MFAKSIKNHPALIFILKTVFYFIVILLLIYLYGYYGAGQEPFIYNEF